MKEYLTYIWKKRTNLLLGLAMIGFSLMTFGWMLGWLVPDSVKEEMTKTMGAWSAPGILAMPATIATFAGVFGAMMVVYVLTGLRRAPSTLDNNA